MSKSVFQRMHNRLLSRLGEPAVLRANTPCTANIEHGVVVNYETGDDKYVQSEYAATVDIANILNTFNPKPGDALDMLAPDGVTIETQYVIDAIASDNGFMSRCVLRSP